MGYISISQGNKKMGLIPSVSMPPHLTCNPQLMCYKDGCYAMNMMRRRENVRKAWTNNLLEFKNNPIFFEESIRTYLNKEKPTRFRWHVGGEIPAVDSKEYIDIMNRVAGDFPSTNFLMFTKMYDYADYMKNHPDNFSIIYSMWPTEDLVIQSLINTYWKLIRDIRHYKIAWLSDDPKTKSEGFNPFDCRLSCTYCGMCWSNKRDIVFKKH